jgi:hypothetical protein
MDCIEAEMQDWSSEEEEDSNSGSDSDSNSDSDESCSDSDSDRNSVEVVQDEDDSSNKEEEVEDGERSGKVRSEGGDSSTRTGRVIVSVGASARTTESQKLRGSGKSQKSQQSDTLGEGEQNGQQNVNEEVVEEVEEEDSDDEDDGDDSEEDEDEEDDDLGSDGHLDTMELMPLNFTRSVAPDHTTGHPHPPNDPSYRQLNDLPGPPEYPPVNIPGATFSSERLI